MSADPKDISINMNQREGLVMNADKMKLTGAIMAQRQSGFTLIEIMVVVIIIATLAGLIAPNIIGQGDKARVTAAKADIRTISTQLDLYKLDNFSYPSTDQGLDALVNKPSDAKNWKQDGYLQKLPKDPWGNDYVYRSPGNNGAYDLYTLGPDGQESDDDVGKE